MWTVGCALCQWITNDGVAIEVHVEGGLSVKEAVGSSGVNF